MQVDRIHIGILISMARKALELNRAWELTEWAHKHPGLRWEEDYTSTYESILRKIAEKYNFDIDDVEKNVYLEDIQ